MQNLQLEPKVAIVTGSSRGLGRSTVLSLAGRGVDSIVTYYANKAAADEVVHQAEKLNRKALALQLDVSDITTFTSFANEVSRVLKETWNREKFDFLVNNAGTHASAPIGEITEAQMDEMYNVHVKGVLFLTQALLPYMADNGRIVNISSGLTRFSIPGSSVYASMKGAVEVLTRYMAKELAPRGIAVNTVAPGAVETDFHGGMVRDDPDLNTLVASMTAMGRVGVPEDIGPMIASLLDGENRWMTGQRLEVSGGMFL